MEVMLKADTHMNLRKRIRCRPEFGILLGMTCGICELYYDMWVMGLVGSHDLTVTRGRDRRVVWGCRGAWEHRLAVCMPQGHHDKGGAF